MAPRNKRRRPRPAADPQSPQRELEAAGQAYKRVEEALRASENRARALLESASEAIVIVNDAGNIVMVKARTETLFGYQRDELLGQPLEILVPNRAQHAHARHRQGFAANPRVRPMGQGLALAGRRKDGSEFPVEISLSYADVDDGTLFMAFVTDITERQHAFEALRRSEAKARAVLESASEGIVMVDATGRITAANSKTGELFGYPRAAMLGQPVEILLPERLRARHAAHRDGFFANRAPARWDAGSTSRAAGRTARSFRSRSA